MRTRLAATVLGVLVVASLAATATVARADTWETVNGFKVLKDTEGKVIRAWSPTQWKEDTAVLESVEEGVVQGNRDDFIASAEARGVETGDAERAWTTVEGWRDSGLALDDEYPGLASDLVAGSQWAGVWPAVEAGAASLGGVVLGAGAFYVGFQIGEGLDALLEIGGTGGEPVTEGCGTAWVTLAGGERYELRCHESPVGISKFAGWSHEFTEEVNRVYAECGCKTIGGETEEADLAAKAGERVAEDERNEENIHAPVGFHMVQYGEEEAGAQVRSLWRLEANYKVGSTTVEGFPMPQLPRAESLGEANKEACEHLITSFDGGNPCIETPTEVVNPSRTEPLTEKQRESLFESEVLPAGEKEHLFPRPTEIEIPIPGEDELATSYKTLLEDIGFTDVTIYTVAESAIDGRVGPEAVVGTEPAEGTKVAASTHVAVAANPADAPPPTSGGISTPEPPGIKLPHVETLCHVFPFGVPCWFAETIAGFVQEEKAPVFDARVDGKTLAIDLAPYDEIMEYARPTEAILSVIGVIILFAGWARSGGPDGGGGEE